MSSLDPLQLYVQKNTKFALLNWVSTQIYVRWYMASFDLRWLGNFSEYGIQSQYKAYCIFSETFVKTGIPWNINE